MKAAGSGVAKETARATRKDARRNYDQILLAASAAVAAYGANASLEEIARQAGVGSATLHRHFSSRQQLLEAVFFERVKGLVAQSHELIADADADPGQALVMWLRSVGAYIAATRGLAATIVQTYQESDSPYSPETCYGMVAEAGDQLVKHAHAVGAIRPEINITDLITIVYALSLVAEQGTDGSADVDRLLLLAIDGIYPSTQPKPNARKKSPGRANSAATRQASTVKSPAATPARRARRTTS